MKFFTWMNRERWLFLFDALILSGVGGMAFLGSANHVYRLALTHGQEGFGAISVTALSEILFAYSGLEIRRRTGWTKLVPLFWLLVAASFIIWANLESTKDRTATGLVVAVVPAVIFAGVASTAETRSWGNPDRARSAKAQVRTLSPTPESPPAESGDSMPGQGSRPERTRKPAVPESPELQRVHTVSVRKVASPAPRSTGESAREARRAALRAAGEEYLASLSAGAPLSRQDVADRLSVTPQRAGQLIKEWTAETVVS